MYQNTVTGTQVAYSAKGSIKDIQDLGYWKVCLRCVPFSQTQNQEKSHWFQVVCMFRSWGRDLLILSCYSRWKLGPSCWKQGGNPRKNTILNLTGKKISKMSLSADNAMITVVWDGNGVILVDKNAARGENQLRRPHHDADRTRAPFQNSLASQDSNRNLASVWQCKSADSAITNFAWAVLTRPQSSNLRFPPIYSPEECNMQHKVWDMMMM
jgi:hypothetical protein